MGSDMIGPTYLLFALVDNRAVPSFWVQNVLPAMTGGHVDIRASWQSQRQFGDSEAYICVCRNVGVQVTQARSIGKGRRGRARGTLSISD
jgi:hypothetical protein